MFAPLIDLRYGGLEEPMYFMRQRNTDANLIQLGGAGVNAELLVYYISNISSVHILWIISSLICSYRQNPICITTAGCVQYGSVYPLCIIHPSNRLSYTLSKY